jgi:hypothetical protein
MLLPPALAHNAIPTGRCASTAATHAGCRLQRGSTCGCGCIHGPLHSRHVENRSSHPVPDLLRPRLRAAGRVRHVGQRRANAVVRTGWWCRRGAAVRPWIRRIPGRVVYVPLWTTRARRGTRLTLRQRASLSSIPCSPTRRHVKLHGCLPPRSVRDLRRDRRCSWEGMPLQRCPAPRSRHGFLPAVAVVRGGCPGRRRTTRGFASARGVL